MKKRVVVFGATGNLGAYVAMHLHNQGYDVIAVGHRKSDNGFFSDRGMCYYSMNIVTVLDNLIYFIGQRSEVYELVELDMNTNEQTVIYQSKTQEAINNAQFYKK